MEARKLESRPTLYQTKLEKPLGSDPIYLWIGEKTEVMVFRDENNTVRVFHSLCPHMGAQLCYRRENQNIHCPWHGLSYDTESLTSPHHRYKKITELPGELVGDQLTIFG